jgi:hypothetical protein
VPLPTPLTDATEVPSADSNSTDIIDDYDDPDSRRSNNLRLGARGVKDSARATIDRSTGPTPYTNSGGTTLIIKGGYLIRTAEIDGKSIALTGDLNATSTIQIIGGAPRNLANLTFNGTPLKFTQNNIGVVTAVAEYTAPKISLPSLVDLEWRYKDSLPEIQASYSDAFWQNANIPKTSNTLRDITTPTSLYGSEYGYHTGHLVYRGRFTAKGNESSLYLQTSGGSAFAMSAFLDSSFLGSFPGYDFASIGNSTFKLPSLKPGNLYIITVIVDNMGLDENWVVGSDEMKNPRGILDYRLDGHAKGDIAWKITGNLGGEAYMDKTRGPLNEGGLWAERQGLHLPDPPAADWKVSKGPTEGIETAGIAWYVTRFKLDLPKGYDIPLSIVFSNVSTATNTSSGNATANWNGAGNWNTTTPTKQSGNGATAYRVLLYVNGWQFGKYVNNIGPQTKFPVPEGTFFELSSGPLSFSLHLVSPLTCKSRYLRLPRHQLRDHGSLGLGSGRGKSGGCEVSRRTPSADGLRDGPGGRKSSVGRETQGLLKSRFLIVL